MLHLHKPHCCHGKQGAKFGMSTETTVTVQLDWSSEARSVLSWSGVPGLSVKDKDFVGDDCVDDKPTFDSNLHPRERDYNFRLVHIHSLSISIYIQWCVGSVISTYSIVYNHSY